MNKNQIITDDWSNPASERLYSERWPGEPDSAERYENGEQCGGCSFFAPFNSDWGLCCHSASRHHLETVFEHFFCPAYRGEGWGPHSFSTDPNFFCRCEGQGSEYWDRITALFEGMSQRSDQGNASEPPAEG